MKRSVKKIGPSHLRRLQDKWQREGEVLLAAAKDRLCQRKHAASQRQAYGGSIRPWEVMQHLETPLMQMLRGIPESPIMRHVAECRKWRIRRSSIPLVPATPPR